MVGRMSGLSPHPCLCLLLSYFIFMRTYTCVLLCVEGRGEHQVSSSDTPVGSVCLLLHAGTVGIYQWVWVLCGFSARDQTWSSCLHGKFVTNWMGLFATFQRLVLIP